MEDTAYRQAAHLHAGVTITLAMPHRDTSPLAPPDLIDVAVAEGTRGDMFAHVFRWPVVTIGAFALFSSPINRTCQVGGVSQGMAVVHTRARTSVLFSSPINSSTSGPYQSGGGGGSFARGYCHQRASGVCSFPTDRTCHAGGRTFGRGGDAGGECEGGFQQLKSGPSGMDGHQEVICVL